MQRVVIEMSVVIPVIVSDLMEMVKRFYLYGWYSVQNLGIPLIRYVGWDALISLISLAVGTLKQWLPREDEGNVEMAPGIEADEEQPRSDDDDT